MTAPGEKGAVIRRSLGAVRRVALHPFTVFVVTAAAAGYSLNASWPFTIADLRYFEPVASPTLNLPDIFSHTQLHGALSAHDYCKVRLRPYPGLAVDEVEVEVEQRGPGAAQIFLSDTQVVRLARGDAERSGLFAVNATGESYRLAALDRTPDYGVFRVHLAYADGVLAVSIDGAPRMRAPLMAPPGDRFSLGSEQTPVVYRDLFLRGRVDGAAFSIYEGFDHPERDGLLWLLCAAGIAVAWLALALVARAIIARPLAAIVRALRPAALGTAATAILAAGGLGSTTATVALLGAIIVLGWGVTVIILRRDSPLNLDCSPSAGRAWRIAAGVLTAAALCAAFAAANAEATRDRRGSRLTIWQTPLSAGGPQTVSNDRVIHFKNRFVRDGTITARLSLARDSKVEIFFRRLARVDAVFRFNSFINREFVDWYSLRLSTIPGDPGGFIKSNDHKVLRELPLLAPGRPCTVTITMRGSAITAAIDGREVAAFDDDEFPYGDPGMVALTGAAEVASFEVLPDPSGALPGGPGAGAFVAALATLAALLFPLLLAFLTGLRPLGAAWVKGLVFELCILMPAAAAAAVMIQSGTGCSPRLLLAIIPIGAAPWMALFVYLNFDGCRRPNAGLLLVLALAFAGGEQALGQTSYGVKWRADYGGGYVRSEFLDWTAEPGSRVWDSYINRLGLRGRDVSGARPKGTVRVICIGGSSTFGDGLARDEETYPHKLEQLLAARYPDVTIEVLNAGVSAYSSFQGVRYLERRLVPLGPDLVIMDFGNNDALQVIFGASDAAYGKRLEEAARHGPTLARRAGAFLGKSLIINGVLANLPVGRPAMPRVSPGEYRHNVQRAMELGRANGFGMLVLNERATDFASEHPYLRHYYDANAALAAETGLAAADPGPLMVKNANDALFLDFIHPTAHGNALIARAAYEKIAGAGLLDAAIARARAERQTAAPARDNSP